MKEGALRKKLQEIGIPNWGNKDLMRRRHIEWLNIHNSNCDADESVRKPKRQLVRELEEWENTQGGRADVKESRVMKKDFDGSGYAKSHKSDFDDLIAQARKKRPKPTSEDTQDANTDTGLNVQHDAQSYPRRHGEILDEPQSEVQPPRSTQPNGAQQQGLNNHGTHLATRQHGAQFPHDKNANSPSQQVYSATVPPEELEELEEPPLASRKPLGSLARKVPILAMSGEPVAEVDLSLT